MSWCLLLMLLGKFPTTGSNLRRFVFLGVAIMVRLNGFLTVGREGGGWIVEAGGSVSCEMFAAGVVFPGVRGHTCGLEKVRREIASVRESSALVYKDATAGSDIIS